MEGNFNPSTHREDFENTQNEVSRQLNNAHEQALEDNTVFDEITGKNIENEKKEISADFLKNFSPDNIDTSFEGKIFHPLSIEPISKEESLKRYLSSGNLPRIFDDIENIMPYRTPEAKEIQVAIIKFDENLTLEDMIMVINKAGARPLTYEELLQFVVANPGCQKEISLVALGSKVSVDGKVIVVRADWNGTNRDLYADDLLSNKFKNYWRFAVTGK